MTRNIRNSGKRSGAIRRRTRWVLSFVFMAAAALSLIPVLQAVHDDNLFELDRNATNDAAIGDDWAQVAAGTSSATVAKFTTDPDGATIYTTGGSKDDLDTNNWRHTSGSVPDKDELQHGYVARYGSHLYFGADREANNGDSQMGFWFFQNDVGPLANGTFGPAQHKDGDILVLSDFTKGGGLPTVRVFQWNGPGGDIPGNGAINGTLDLLAGTTAQPQDCVGPPAVPAGDNFCATVNAVVTPSPWAFTPKSGPANSFQPGEFYEGGIDLSFLHLENECFSAFLAETRSSQSVDATLKDFVANSFEHCSSDLTTTPQGSVGGNFQDITSISIGTGSVSVRDKAVLQIGGSTSWTGNLDFFLCGPVAIGQPKPVCTTGGVKQGNTIPVSDSNQPVTAFSNPATVLQNVGQYCWRAVFTATSPASIPPATDARDSECFTVLPVSPTVGTTIVPAGALNIGQSAYDTAQLSGATTTAGGTISYKLFAQADCTSEITDLTPNPNTVVNGVAPNSNPYQFNSAGTFYFRATYSGDGNNTGPVSSACSAEPITINPNTPSINTVIVPETAVDAQGRLSVGGSAHDTSSLTGATANAGGTVTYSLFSDNSCTTLVQALGTKTVTNGVVPASDSYTFNTAGTFYFYAVYSGDANNQGANSGCTAEPITVKPNTPVPTSTPVVQIKDTFNVTGLTSTATGDVVVGLYTSSTCTTGQVGSNATFAANSFNATNKETTFVGVVAGDYYFKISYAGDTNNSPFSSCVEKVGVTITSLP